MRLTFPDFGPAVLDDLHASLVAAGVPGFTGVTLDAAGLHVEFPDRGDLTDAERAAIEDAVASYVYAPSSVG